MTTITFHAGYAKGGRIILQTITGQVISKNGMTLTLTTADGDVVIRTTQIVSQTR